MAKGSMKDDAGAMPSKGGTLGVNAWLFALALLVLAIYLALPKNERMAAIADQHQQPSNKEQLQAVIEEQCAQFMADAAPGAGKAEARRTCDALRKEAAAR